MSRLLRCWFAALLVACRADADDAAVEFRIADRAVDAWTLTAAPEGAVGETVALEVVNVGADTSSALTIALAGIGAGDFELVAAGATCAGAQLAPGARCRLPLRFAPRNNLPLREAELIVRSSAADVAILTLTGPLRTSFFRFTDAAPHQPTMRELGVPWTQGFRIENVSDVALRDVIIDAEDVSDVTMAVSSTRCGSTLEPAEICSIEVTATARARAGVYADVVARAIGERGVFHLAFFAGSRLSVDVAGGHVESSPRGLTCSAGRCTGLFAGDVELVAYRGDTRSVATWTTGDGSCARPAEACVVAASDAARRVQVTLGPTAP